MILSRENSRRTNCEEPVFRKLNSNKFLNYSNQNVKFLELNRQKFKLQFLTAEKSSISLTHPEEKYIDWHESMMKAIDFTTNDYSLNNSNLELRDSQTSLIINWFKNSIDRIILYIITICVIFIIIYIIIITVKKKIQICSQCVKETNKNKENTSKGKSKNSSESLKMSNLEHRFTKLSSNEEETSKLLETSKTLIIDNENSNESKTLGKS